MISFLGILMTLTSEILCLHQILTPISVFYYLSCIKTGKVFQLADEMHCIYDGVPVSSCDLSAPGQTTASPIDKK